MVLPSVVTLSPILIPSLSPVYSPLLSVTPVADFLAKVDLSYPPSGALTSVNAYNVLVYLLNLIVFPFSGILIFVANA